MKTITNYVENEIIIKNSRFIACIFNLEEKNIDNYLIEIKNKYPKATHYCYAYIYDDYKKVSDDGEPSSTAGQPLLNVLEKEQLNHILVIVVRYFGGIKLGAGGLVRAYTKSLTEALKLAQYEILIKGYKVEINFNYDEEKNIQYILGKKIILEKDYQSNIKYIVLVDENTLEKLKKYDLNIIQEQQIKEIN